MTTLFQIIYKNSEKSLNLENFANYFFMFFIEENTKSFISL